METVAHIINVALLMFVAMANIVYAIAIKTDLYRSIKVWYALNSSIALIAYLTWRCDMDSSVIIITFILSATMAGGTLAAYARAVEMYGIDLLTELLTLPNRLLRFL